jgi:hypothetical protein
MASDPSDIDSLPTNAIRQKTNKNKGKERSKNLSASQKRKRGIDAGSAEGKRERNNKQGGEKGAECLDSGWWCRVLTNSAVCLAQ